MKTRTIATFLLACGGAVLACTPSPHGDAAATSAPSGADPEITAFIGKIRAVDNHSHANSIAPGDSDQDALPLEVIFPFEVPVLLRPDNPDWLAAYKALYKYPHADMSDAHLNELRGAMQRIAREQGEKFPAWVLDEVGTEVLLTNRVAMGPGLAPPRFRWVSYVDALMLPLSTKAEAATSPDREKLFPLEDKLLQRYMSDLKVTKLPATLDAYLETVVTHARGSAEGRLRGGEVRGRLPPSARLRRDARLDREQDLGELRRRRRAVACRLQGAPGLPLPLHRARGRPPRNGSPHPFVPRTWQFLPGGRGRPAAPGTGVQRPDVAQDELRHRPWWRCLFVSRRRHALEAERIPRHVSDDAALHAGQARRGPEGLAHSVSGEGALWLRRCRVRAGYGLGGGGLDRYQERASGARVGAQRHDP